MILNSNSSSSTGNGPRITTGRTRWRGSIIIIIFQNRCSTPPHPPSSRTRTATRSPPTGTTTATATERGAIRSAPLESTTSATTAIQQRRAAAFPAPFTWRATRPTMDVPERGAVTPGGPPWGPTSREDPVREETSTTGMGVGSIRRWTGEAVSRCCSTTGMTRLWSAREEAAGGARTAPSWPIRRLPPRSWTICTPPCSAAAS
mmetsp:Transcript_29264/g.70604  ORF Transcript_29264/g.70604 Transcript_29264/m.70604 type:complete len:204 (-) Transcript_29264:556-1167(-)